MNVGVFDFGPLLLVELSKTRRSGAGRVSRVWVGQRGSMIGLQGFHLYR